MNPTISPSPSNVPAAPVFAAGHERVRFHRLIEEIRGAARQHIVGLDATLDLLLVALFAGGHVLVESTPGLGKTTLAKVLAGVSGLPFGRVQFTPDLLPFDILGSERPVSDTAGEGPRLKFTPGPIFTTFLLADEINRAPPKTQAALLEAMAERQVTIASVGQRLALSPLFFVLATQNPIEMEGTYELPEAQLDRFMMKLHIDVPDEDQLERLIEQQQDRHRRPVPIDPIVPRFFGLATDTPEAVSAQLKHLADAAIAQMASFPFRREVAQLVRVTNLQRLMPRVPTKQTLPEFSAVPLALQQRTWNEIAEGASPRAALDLVRAAQVMALLEDRAIADWKHVRRVAPSVLGHRLTPTFDGAALRRRAMMQGYIEELCDAVAPKG